MIFLNRSRTLSIRLEFSAQLFARMMLGVMAAAGAPNYFTIIFETGGQKYVAALTKCGPNDGYHVAKTSQQIWSALEESENE